jgi:hypothetical protein
MLACTARRLVNAFADEGKLAFAGTPLARRDARRSGCGVACAVISVVDNDSLCVSVLGVHPRGELGLGGAAVL